MTVSAWTLAALALGFFAAELLARAWFTFRPRYSVFPPRLHAAHRGAAAHPGSITARRARSVVILFVNRGNCHE